MGTAESPFIIDTPGKLAKVSYDTHKGINLSAHFKMTKNLDMGAHEFRAICATDGGTSNAFKGKFDGNGCVIEDLYHVRNAYWQGLFEVIDGGFVVNVGLVNPNFSGSGSYVGGFAGKMVSGAIRQSFIFGGIIKNSVYGIVGGLVGYMTDGQITDCFVNNTLFEWNASASTISIGGLVGFSTENCLFISCYFYSSHRNMNVAGAYGIAPFAKEAVGVFCCYYGPLGKVGEDVTSERLKSVHNNFSDPYSWQQRSYINGGFPYMKQYYWEENCTS